MIRVPRISYTYEKEKSFRLGLDTEFDVTASIVDADIITPYTEADLFELQFEQSADVMWIVHPDYAPRKLSRVSASEFTLAKISFTNGPFIKRNDFGICATAFLS